MHYATGEDVIRRISFMKEANRKDDCAAALAGIDDPAAFRRAADAFADSIDGMGVGDEISEEQFDKMCAFAKLLPPETP